VEKCSEHSGINARIENLEKYKDESKKSINKAHERVDGMKNWVIAGMTSMVVQLFVIIATIIIVYTKIN